MGEEAARSVKRKSLATRLAESVVATLGVGLLAFLAGANALPSWPDLRLNASVGSGLEVAAAIALAIVAITTCVRRLIVGLSGGTELQRFCDAISDDGAAGGMLESLDDASN